MSLPLKLDAPWPQVKDRLKEHNTQLTDEDLAYSPGQEDALLERLQKKMKKSKDEIRAYIESVSSNSSQAG
jgi:uncharacterized protein YjbJ (UPF0337 family)